MNYKLLLLLFHYSPATMPPTWIIKYVLNEIVRLLLLSIQALRILFYVFLPFA